MFKDFLDYKDPKKGYIVNDSFNNPTILDTGFHRYKNVYNFYNNTKAGQIGVVKSIVNQNNNILWTPNQGNNIEMNLTQTTSSTSTNPDNFLLEDIGVDYDSYWEQTFTTIGGYNSYNPCSCSVGTFSLPVAIQIIDYNLNRKIPFVWVGVNKSINKGYSGYCSVLNGNIGVSYDDINYYIIASAGIIPSPLYYTHWSYWRPFGYTYFGCTYFIPTPGNITLTYIDWYQYCNYIKQDPYWGTAYFYVFAYELKRYINGCINGCISGDLWLWQLYSGFLPPGEYIRVRVYEKRFSNICV
jgi:hypothetical protein